MTVPAGLLTALAFLPAVLAGSLPEPPAPVVLWFEQEAPSAVHSSENSGLEPEQLVTVEVGTPTAVGTWSEEFLAGRVGTDPLAPSGEWVAPVTLDGVGVGAVVATAGETGTVADHRVIWDGVLGGSLATHPTHTFILDAETAGWFRLSGEELTPVTEPATDVLAGSIAIEAYQPFLIERLGTDDGPAPLPAHQDSSWVRPVLITAGAALAVLLTVGAVVWIRRPETP